jgi:hypothetical protein
MLTRWTLTLVLGWLLAGCGTTRPPAENLGCNLTDYAAPESVYTRLPERQRKRRSDSYNILVLSAGGQLGAYGAGFLNKWGIEKSNIDAVTGVSTGALMATHAFLGDYKTLYTRYTKLKASDVFLQRSLLSLLTSNSFLDTSPKDAYIESVFGNEDLLKQVVEEGKSGRSLYIGTVNLDTGEFLMVDMVKLAGGYENIADPALRTAKRLACYQAVIGASSAIPVAFAPKFIDGYMYVDGGTRFHTFFIKPKDWDKMREKDKVSIHVVSLIHGELAVPCRHTSDAANGGKTNGWAQTALRTTTLTVDSGMKASIRAMDDKAKALGASTYYMTAQQAVQACRPYSTCKNNDALGGDDQFCPAFEQCLAEHGATDATGLPPTNWEHASNWRHIDDLNLGTGQDMWHCPLESNASNAPHVPVRPAARPNMVLFP